MVQESNSKTNFISLTTPKNIPFQELGCRPLVCTSSRQNCAAAQISGGKVRPTSRSSRNNSKIAKPMRVGDALLGGSKKMGEIKQARIEMEF